MKLNSNFLILFFLCICFFLLGILTEKVFLNKLSADLKKSKNDSFRSLTNDRKFTNPLLDCEPNFFYINSNMEKIITEKSSYYKKKPSIEQVSVYFRHLNNGSWYGINEKEKFIPASLNKVPLMIASFKLSEENPEILNYKFSFDEVAGSFKKIDNIDSFDKKEKIFSFYDVIEYMIRYSHNETAGFLIDLLNSVDQKFVDKVFLDLGMQPPSSNELHQVTTKDYASFFRVLYNSTYINNKNSEMALFFLSETEFKDGLVKGIDENIIISHKFGQISEGKLFQLHDCGIIYYPENNYVLCVMVKGYDINQMANVIQDISKAVYEEVKTQITNQ